MSWYLKIVLILFGLAYLISPVDIIPELFLPFVGWLDDSVVIASIYYLIRYGRLPNFFFKKKSFKQPFGQNYTNFSSNIKNQQSTSNASFSNNTQSSTRLFKPGIKTKQALTPFEVLEISPDASRKEIQNAYKQAIKKYHPDKLSHLGQDFSNLANEKFLEIQKAYETLMKHL